MAAPVPQRALLARLKALYAGLSTAQIATIAVSFVAIVALIIGAGYLLNAASYRLLFSDMDAEAANAVIARLREQKVPFQIADGGRAIKVPESRIDELRLEFASSGMPATGRIGFEIFDRTAFGATEFLEQVNYRRALEGEIARTIGTISEVASARVHIAMAKDSLFSEKEQPAKASVILKLRANRPLPAATVNGIVSLVAASVEGLASDAVVVIDSFGRPLARPAQDNGEPLGGAELERQQRVERDLATRVVALLEPVVGADRVRVNVAARLDPQSQEQTEERWDPTTVVRSRQTTSETGPGAAGAAGVSGARSNLPLSNAEAKAAGTTPSTGPPSTAPIVPNGPGRSAETVNYEVSKLTRHIVQPRGNIARLSVAVILDDVVKETKNATGQVARSTKPRDRAEIQKIHGLVAAAVGLDTTRGDVLTVENISFDEPLVEDAPSPSLWERWGPLVLEASRVLAVLLLGVFGFLFFVRPMMRRVASPFPALPAAGETGGQFPRTIEDLEGEIGAQLDAAVLSLNPENRKMPVLTKRLAALTQTEPDSAAKLMRAWLNDEGR